MRAFTQKDKAMNNEVYAKFIANNLPNGWNETCQIRNFLELVAIREHTKIPIKGSSVLDAGCGTGDFSQLLKKMGVKDCLGIDICAEAIEIAKRNYPSQDFVHADFLETELEQFDYVFCSGGLSLKLHGDNYAFLEAMVRKMWELSVAGTAFNFMIEDRCHKSVCVFDYSPERVEQICSQVCNGAEYRSIQRGSVMIGEQVTAYLTRA